MLTNRIKAESCKPDNEAQKASKGNTAAAPPAVRGTRLPYLELELGLGAAAVPAPVRPELWHDARGVAVARRLVAEDAGAAVEVGHKRACHGAHHSNRSSQGRMLMWQRRCLQLVESRTREDATKALSIIFDSRTQEDATKALSTPYT